ncbi:MFS transporter [Streptomyces sp. NPDC059534]|uniref:MFS transporter n=1 Tax=Streptomyces sp. NPDC059534 TaxID=3346859 RepID=UPI0036B6D725
MTGTITHGPTTITSAEPHAGRTSPARAAGLLLALVAVLYVIAPVVHATIAPLVEPDLGVNSRHQAVAQVVGLALAIAVLAAAGRAGDLWGRRSVLTAALAVLCAGSLVLTAAFGPWSYILGRVIMAAALAAVFVSCLAFMASTSMPGRIRQVMGGWLAAMSVGFVLAVNLVPRATQLAGWRLLMALLAVASLAALLLVRRYLPEAIAPDSGARPDPVRTACQVVCAMALATALQLAPLWGWQDAWVGGLLIVAVLALTAARIRFLRLRPGPGHAAPVPGLLWAAALVAGVALGFTQTVLTLAVPSLTAAAGISPAGGALALSAFGAGGAAGCLVARHRNVSPLAGASLGLPLAALGLPLLHVLLNRSSHPMVSGPAAVTLVGFGTMLAMTPQMARFLAAIPRPHLGVNTALLPAAILLGTAAAQAMPYTSAAGSAPLPSQARELLWIGTIVVGVAALALGRPVVALAVAASAALQYVMVDADISPSVSVIVALAVGAAAGTAAWYRREQTECLTRTRETASALQHAVLHSIPSRLGALHLAGLYRPATRGTAVGGDFLEALNTPFGTRVLIGDVRGKGLQAVQTVTDLLGCFRSRAHETADLGEVAACLDRQVQRAAHARGDDELFATAFLLQQDPDNHALDAINCGHLAPLEVTPHLARELTVPSELPLGFGALTTAGAIRPHRLDLTPGSTLLTHTDGLTEARNSTGEFYPLAQRLSSPSHHGPDALVRHLDADVRDWTHHLTDDIAVVALAVVAA